jgi:hypothetical protein
MKKPSKMTDKIRRLLAIGNSVGETALKLNIPKNRVYTVRWLDKKKQEKISKNHTRNLAKSIKNTTAHFAAIEKQQDRSVFTPDNAVEPEFAETWETSYNPVNHPPHYKTGGIETIDYIEAKDLNYRLGNVIKYVSRAGKKNSDPIEDLEKAAWYLQREIDARKRA